MHRRSGVFLVGLTVAVFLLVVFFRVFVLLDAPVADDESAYMFVAQTLQHGRLINPVPKDPEFFTNQFVVMSPHGWYGKYPIGHPLLLAAADLVGARLVLGPVLTCLSLLLTYGIGKKIFGSKTALLALLLLAISPHFLLTGATLLSQTTSTLFLLLALYFTVGFLERGQIATAGLAGLSLAYGILVRPFPGILFFAATFAVILFQPNGTGLFDRLKTRGRGLLVLAFFAALAGGVLLVVNHEQTGSFLRTAYHEVHGRSMGVLGSTEGQRSMSVVAALLRQNLWLFGWPVSLLFVWFVRRNRYLPLLAALVVAEYLYRAVFPKTVVSSTGPVYVTEIVPLLALASASGMVEVKKRLASMGVRRPEAALISLVASLTIVALMGFWPVHIASLSRGAHAWRFPYEALEAEHIPKALVFADTMVNVASGATWAYYPPNPSPSMDDNILFVRTAKPTSDDDGVAAMKRFHQRHFPDRPAFVLRLDAKKSSFLPLWPPKGWPPRDRGEAPAASPP
jgi:hypothetical protein